MVLSINHDSPPINSPPTRCPKSISQDDKFFLLFVCVCHIRFLYTQAASVPHFQLVYILHAERRWSCQSTTIHHPSTPHPLDVPYQLIKIVKFFFCVCRILFEPAGSSWPRYQLFLFIHGERRWCCQSTTIHHSSTPHPLDVPNLLAKTTSFFCFLFCVCRFQLLVPAYNSGPHCLLFWSCQSTTIHHP